MGRNQTTNWTQIIVGVIVGAILGIAGTFFVFQGRISSLEGQLQKMNFPRVQQSAAPQVTPSQPSACFSVKLTAPIGARDRRDATAYRVPSDVEVLWDLDECIMTIEYYQGNQLKRKYKNMQSGQKINIGVSGSGETEIKIWREGSAQPSDSIWVWVP